MSHYLLLIHCPDERGLVSKITTALFQHGLNIVNNAEFVERNGNYFFMRTEFSGDFDETKLQQDLEEVLPTTAVIKISSKQKKDIVILATKEHHCISDLLVRHAFKELQANVKAVISNYETLQDLTQKFGVPFHYIPHEGKSREAHEQEIIDLLEFYNPDFIVLAKYMRIFSAAFTSRFVNRIINIHHSFLPAFIGAKPYNQAYERGVKIIGATAHFVNDSLDEGPIITQDVTRINHSYNAKEMAQAGKDVEKLVLANALRLVLNEQVFVYRNTTIVFE